MSSELTSVVLPGRAGRTTVLAGLRGQAARTRTLTVDAAILLAVGAGVAHLISIRTHWDWWQASGVFFALITVAQFALAAALAVHRTGVRTLLAGVWSNVLVVGVYVASRLVALPGQPVTTAHHAPKAPGRAFLPARPEGVGSFDLFALVLELALIVLLTGLLPARWRTRTTSALMWCGVAMCALAAWAITTGHLQF